MLKKSLLNELKHKDIENLNITESSMRAPMLTQEERNNVKLI